VEYVHECGTLSIFTVEKHRHTRCCIHDSFRCLVVSAWKAWKDETHSAISAGKARSTLGYEGQKPVVSTLTSSSVSSFFCMRRQRQPGRSCAARMRITRSPQGEQHVT
jgi:hypothetical protein